MTFPSTATITAALTVIPVAVAAYTKLTEVLRPLLQRRKLRVLVADQDLADRLVKPDAKASINDLPEQGSAQPAVQPHHAL